MVAEEQDPLAVSLLVELPPEMTEEQAKLLGTALKRTVLDFSRALTPAGTELRVSSVSGPAAPVELTEVKRRRSVPGVALKRH